ncbi:MAG: heme exporter protein CcmB [Pseudomonadota bacterium]
MGGFVAILQRDLTLSIRAGGGAALSIAFFFLMILIFSLSFGPDPQSLSTIAAPAVWTAAILSAFVSFDRIFQDDFEDGGLDVIAETTDFLEGAFIAKTAAHWLTTAAPIILLTPAASAMLALGDGRLAPLMASLLVGTPALSLIGAFAAALTVSLRRAGVLVTILSAPLFTPLIIFGVEAANAERLSSPDFAPAMMFLGAYGLVCLIVAPFAGAAAIRANLT